MEEVSMGLNTQNQPDAKCIALTPMQKQRSAYLSTIYGKRADEIVQFISRGENSWINIQEKIKNLNRTNRQQREYNNSLYEEFNVRETYSIDDIIAKVADVRRDMDLDPYNNRIKIQCLRDFTALFITENVIDPETGKHIGYKPLFNLTPEEEVI